MADNRSPTSTATMTTTEPDDMASYSQDTEGTSAHSSPEHYRGEVDGAAEGLEWYEAKTPQLEHHSEFNYQEESPDLGLLHSDFSQSYSLRDHATFVRKSVVLSDSMASMALKDIGSAQGESSERTTQLAMTNSPSFSALGHILERKEAKFLKKPLVTPIIEQDEGLPSSPNYTEVVDESPNLIQFDDDSPSIEPPHEILNSFTPTNAAADIFKTPDVPQSQIFPHQQYRSIIDNIEISSALVPVSPQTAVATPAPAPAAGPHSALSSTPIVKKPIVQEVEEIKPQPLPKSQKSALFSQQYSQRSSSMPVLANDKKDVKEKRRSFLGFFRNRRSVSSSTVPQTLPPIPPSKPLKTSKSFTIPKAPSLAVTEPQAQRSTSSNSLFSAFKLRKSKSVILSEQTNVPPTINIISPKETNLEEQERSDSEDDFSVSSDGFNEDFNNLEVEEEPIVESTGPPTAVLPAQPKDNRLSQISQGSTRHSLISQGETIFPKNLSAQEVESIISLERNRSFSRQSLVSNRQSLVSIEHAISRRSSLDNSIQVSPEFQSPEYGSNYLTGDYDDQENEEELFNIEEFSQGLQLNDHEEDEHEEDLSSQFAEFAEYIDFGGALNLDLDLGFDMEINRSPLSQPALINSPSLFEEEYTSSSVVESPAMNKSPLSSPFLQQSAYVSPQLQRPVSMSFRGLKAPAFNVIHSSESCDSMPSDSSVASTEQEVRKVVFSSKVTLFDVYAEDEYDRKPDIATCNQLTPQLAMNIRKELNALKSEMEVHEDSKCYTHFF